MPIFSENEYTRSTVARCHLFVTFGKGTNVPFGAAAVGTESAAMRGPPCTNDWSESLKSYAARMSVFAIALIRFRYTEKLFTFSSFARFQLRLGSVHDGSGAGFALRDCWNASNLVWP